MPETGRDFEFGVLGAIVAISIEDDRLKREAKLERFDLELSVRAVDCLAGVALGVTCCSEDVADEKRDGSLCCSSESWVALFLCFSAMGFQ